MPVWVIQEIDKIRRRFLWHGVATESHKLNLANWSIVCTPRELGGLGVLDLKVFNLAMLMKWCWHWAKLEEKLWKLIFHCTHWQSDLQPDSTLFTKTLKSAYPFFDISTIRKPGNGETIRFWLHEWGFGILKLRFPILFTYSIDPLITLSEVKQIQPFSLLFHGNLSERAILERENLQQQILQTVQLVQNQHDDVVWKLEVTGVFSVKTAYFGMMKDHRVKTDNSKI